MRHSFSFARLALALTRTLTLTLTQVRQSFPFARLTSRPHATQPAGSHPLALLDHQATTRRQLATMCAQSS